MNLSSLFGTSKDFEKKGVWIVVTGVGDTAMAVKIGRAGGANSDYLLALAEAFRPYRRMMEMDNMDPVLAKEVLMEVYAKTITFDWKNVTLPNSEGVQEPVECNAENALRAFKAYPDFFEFIRTESDRIQNFRDDDKKALAGNSPRS